jgi:hypothetical protein
VISLIKQTALREWQGALRYWVFGWLLSCLICVIARPFETDQLGVINAVGYWLLINGIAVVIMFGVLRGFGPRLDDKFVFVAVLGSALFSLLFTPALMLVNERLYGFDLPVHFFASNFLISCVVFCIVWVSRSRHAAPAPLLKPKFENRLSKYQTAQLWAITAQDHYLHVQTDQGSELILMRMSDALLELADHDGVQIHRSHWVARAGIARKTATSVTLHNDDVLPISRSNGPAVKAFFAARLPKVH